MKKKHLFFSFFIALIPISKQSTSLQKAHPPVSSFFTHHDALQEELVKLITNETKKIQIATFRFSDPIIAEALINKKLHGIKIEIITDAGGLDGRINQILRLHKHNIPIYIYPTSKFLINQNLMHHKFCIFSQNGKNKEQLIWTGSYNLTKAAATKNRENAVLINDSTTWKHFYEEFKNLKKIAQRL